MPSRRTVSALITLNEEVTSREKRLNLMWLAFLTTAETKPVHVPHRKWHKLPLTHSTSHEKLNHFLVISAATVLYHTTVAAQARALCKGWKALISLREGKKFSQCYSETMGRKPKTKNNEEKAPMVILSYFIYAHPLYYLYVYVLL